MLAVRLPVILAPLEPPEASGSAGDYRDLPSKECPILRGFRPTLVIRSRPFWRQDLILRYGLNRQKTAGNHACALTDLAQSPQCDFMDRIRYHFEESELPHTFLAEEGLDCDALALLECINSRHGRGRFVAGETKASKLAFTSRLPRFVSNYDDGTKESDTKGGTPASTGPALLG
jgi:hypothetical protein